jgi:glycosyltransferase involved in cell wall biosynthesis
MRRDVPVVVTPEVGAVEIVSVAGLVVEGDSEPLSSAISRLTADLNLLRSIEAGRQAAAHFNWNYVAAEMEDLYNGLSLDHRGRTL